MNGAVMFEGWMVLYYFFPVISWLWLLYFLVALMFSVSSKRSVHIPAVILVFWLEHFFYGLGFLAGMLNKRKNAEKN